MTLAHTIVTFQIVFPSKERNHPPFFELPFCFRCRLGLTKRAIARLATRGRAKAALSAEARMPPEKAGNVSYGVSSLMRRPSLFSLALSR
jgi:hypothetical protein